MRERLIKLIKNSLIKHIDKSCLLAENIADDLLANGVIVPPMRLGQTCFRPHHYLNEVDECRVSSITQKADGTFKIRLTNLRGKRVSEITADDIGKTVFLTREEAEAALKKKGADDERN